MKIKVRQRYMPNYTGEYIRYEITNSASNYINFFYPATMPQRIFDDMIEASYRLTQAQ